MGRRQRFWFPIYEVPKKVPLSRTIFAFCQKRGFAGFSMDAVKNKSPSQLHTKNKERPSISNFGGGEFTNLSVFKISKKSISTHLVISSHLGVFQ